MSLKLYRKRGSPNWYIRGTVRGIVVDESSGVAEKSVAETIRAKREWESLQESIFGRKATATFLEVAVSYMEAGGERRFMAPLIKHFGNQPLKNVDQAAIEGAAKALYPTAVKSTWNRQVFTPVSAVLKHAAGRGLCEHRQIERPSQPKGRVRWLAPVEADKLIDACAPHLKPLVTFLFYTGARLSEALYLDWRQVDLLRGEVQFLETKNGDPRGVPLHARVMTALTSLKHREGAVFRRPSRPSPAAAGGGCGAGPRPCRDPAGEAYARKSDGGGQIKTGFSGACRRAGISDFSPHDCRHTWATWHYAANRDLVSLMELGGWQSEKMVLRYAHMNVSHLSQSIAALPWEKSGNSSAGGVKKKATSKT